MNSFDDLYLSFHDNQEWLSKSFETMTFAEYRGFVSYCFKELGFAEEAREGAEFCRVKGLLFAIARKELQIAYFMDGLTEDNRAKGIESATAVYELAKGFYAEHKQAAVQAAWEANKDLGKRFGYPSVVAEILAPHSLFRES